MSVDAGLARQPFDLHILPPSSPSRIHPYYRPPIPSFRTYPLQPIDPSSSALNKTADDISSRYVSPPTLLPHRQWCFYLVSGPTVFLYILCTAYIRYVLGMSEIKPLGDSDLCRVSHTIQSARLSPSWLEALSVPIAQSPELN
ncbi:hypothetical protein C8R44DRAFT_879400 [Mycena epipterygia]|nr:hypothetical protein C8R44DRAFT_879400 [Mycena epipterygia]